MRFSLRKLGVLGTTLGWAIISATSAQAGRCGHHADDELIGNFKASLMNGVVFGKSIADVEAPATLWMQGSELSFQVAGGGMQGELDFPLKRVSAAKREPLFNRTVTGKHASLQDMAFVTGCDTPANIPQYFGQGHWVSADGQIVPATLRMFIWKAPANVGTGESTFAIGVMHSEILNGMIMLQ